MAVKVDLNLLDSVDNEVVELVQRLGRAETPASHIMGYSIEQSSRGPKKVTVTFIADNLFGRDAEE